MDGHACIPCGALLTPDRYLCPGCTNTTAEALRAYWYREPTPYGLAPNLFDELDTTITRQARMAAANNGSRGTDRPLPFDTTASDARAGDVVFLSASVARFGGPLSLARARNGTAAARWLHAHLQSVGGQHGAGEWAPDVGRRYTRAVGIIDRPPGAWYAGKCQDTECQADLYAEDGAATIRCRYCGLVHDVEQQRAHLLAGIESVLASAIEICRAVYLLDRQPVTRSQINNWVARGQLVRRGRNAGGHHTYRVGDVLDLVRARRGR